jgi:hypothetical protein
VGAAWDISKESFYRFSTIPYLRFRTSYGYQGNVNNSLAPYTIINYSTINSNLNNLPFANIRVPANPGLTWESSKQLNFAVDFYSKKDIISGYIEYYRKKAVDLLLTAMNDPTSGINNLTKNSASMEGSGVELFLKSLNFNRGNFKWITEFGFTSVKSKVTDYLLNDNGFTARTYAQSTGLFASPIKGRSPYSIFSYQFAGLDGDGNPQGYEGSKVSTNYQKIFDQKYDTATIIYNGSSIPTKFGYLTNTFSFKGVSLMVNFSYSFDYYFKKSTINYYNLINLGISHADYTKRWKIAGDEATTTVPSFVYPDNSFGLRDEFYANSSVNVLKADNIRLQYIRLAYNIGKNKLKRLPFENITVYSSVNNLGIVWRANKEGLDPDVDGGNAAYPIPRTVAVGLNIGF